MIKKRYLFLIFIICLFSISAVSAEEITNDSDVVANDYDSSLIAESVDGNSSGDSIGTFDELQNEIDAVEDGGTFNLTRNYKYVNGSTDGISITKAITIDGKGHTLDGNQLSRVFYITGNNVVLKNISFINGYRFNELYDENYSGGSAIIWDGENGIIDNCNFNNNVVESEYSSASGAIIWNGYNGIIKNSNFTNNMVTSEYGQHGGSIFWNGNNGSLLNCKFNNNTACGDSGGGSVLWYSDNGLISNCTFFNNSARYGGAIYIYATNVNVLNSIFEYNNVGYELSGEGAAIFCGGDDCNIINCSFSNNYCKIIKHVSSSGIVVIWYGNNCLIKDCTFKNNSESYMGVIYAKGTEKLLISNSSFINNLGNNINCYCYDFLINGCNFSGNYDMVLRGEGILNKSYCQGNGNIVVKDDVRIIKFGTEILTNNQSLNYCSPDNFSALLKDENNLLLNNEILNFIFEKDKKISIMNITNDNGIVNVSNEKINLNAGVWNLTVMFNGNVNYAPCNAIATITVLPANSSLIIDDINSTEGHEIVINVTVSSSNNLTVNEGSVVFFDGETEIGESQVINGKATLTYVPAIDGEHTITAIFDSVNYLSSSSTAKLLVDSATIDVLVENGTVGFNSTFVAEVKGLYSTVNEGNVKFYVDDEYLGVVPVVNGFASIVYVPLVAGDYSVTAIYCDSSKFLDDEDSVDYHVFEADSSVVVVPVNGTVGHEIVINVIISSSNNLTVNEGSVVFFDGETEIGESQVKNGKATLTYVPTTAGEHTITAVFDSDNYLNSTNTNILAVEKASIDLNINEIITVFFSNPSEFNVNVKSNSREVNEGNIKYYVNNKLIGSSLVNNGKASFDYIVDESGTFNLLVCFDETDNYLSSNTSTTFSVVKMPTTLSGNSIIFDENDTKTYTTVLTDNNKNGVENQSVQILVIKYSGEYSEFYAITDSNGVSTYDINSLNGGMWYVTGTFDGDENYIGSSFEDKFIIIKIETTTTIEEINNPRVNHTYKLKANIHDENGKLVKEGIVQFYLDGVDIGSIDLSKNQGHQSGLLGAANPMDYILGADDEDDSDLYIEYTPSKAGEYTLSAVYEGTTIYKSSNETTTLIVKEDDPYNSSAPDVTKYFHGPEEFVVSLVNNNNPVVNAQVKITINGKTYQKTTNYLGQTSIGLNLISGTYNVTTEYNGFKVYSTVTIKDTVIANDFTKMFRNGTQYSGTFVDSQGNILKGANIVININGVHYYRTTDENGVAGLNINLPPGTYVLTADNPTSGEKHTTTITVLPTIVENHDLIKYYKNSTQYTIRLLGPDGKPVGSGERVTFNINGIFYTRTSDASGYATLDINLPPGTYIITADYNGLKASNTITVKSVLFANDLYMKYKDGSQFTAKVLDGQGKPLAGATVRFNINGVFYNRVTGEDGIARLDINLLMGNYVITSSYNGLNAANNVIIGNNPMYYTIGSNPLDYNYYMNEYNKFSLDWYYVDQYASNVKTIYDIYGNSGMELQTVRYGTQYICYEPSTGKEVALNGAGEVISWSINRDYTEDYILYDEFNNELARGRWINGEGIGQYYS